MLVSALNHKQMAVLNSGIEVNSLAAKFLLKELDEHVGLFCFQTTARMVLDVSVLDADKVAAYCHIIGSKFNADTCSLERTSALVDLALVVSKD